MNTYTKEQVSNALNLLNDIWGNEPAYAALPDESKTRLAEIILRAFETLKT